MKKTRIKEPIPPPVGPPAKRGRPKKIDADLRSIADKTRQAMWNIAALNRMPPEMMEERINRKLPKIYQSHSLQEAAIESERAIQNAEMMCLAKRADGTIPGPKTIRSLETQARKNESLALWLYKQGNDKASATATKRAASLRAEIEELKKANQNSEINTV